MLIILVSPYGNHVQKPTILLIESADSWTIAHEFMHYLFDRARLMDDDTSESKVVDNMTDAKEDFMDSRSKYKMNNRYFDENHKRETIHNFAVFTRVQQQLSISYEMEEMAIEKFLRTIYVHHAGHDFDQNSFDRSTRYIGRTGSKALSTLNTTLDICEDLRQSLNGNDQSLLNDLTQTCQKTEESKKPFLKLARI